MPVIDAAVVVVASLAASVFVFIALN
jgi:hypothetical protein